MKIIEDVALELLLIDAQIEFVNKALGHKICGDEILIYIASVSRREAGSACPSTGVGRCCITHKCPSNVLTHYG